MLKNLKIVAILLLFAITGMAQSNDVSTIGQNLPAEQNIAISSSNIGLVRSWHLRKALKEGRLLSQDDFNFLFKSRGRRNRKALFEFLSNQNPTDEAQLEQVGFALVAFAEFGITSTKRDRLTVDGKTIVNILSHLHNGDENIREKADSIVTDYLLAVFKGRSQNHKYHLADLIIHGHELGLHFRENVWQLLDKKGPIAYAQWSFVHETLKDQQRDPSIREQASLVLRHFSWSNHLRFKSDQVSEWAYSLSKGQDYASNSLLSQRVPFTSAIRGLIDQNSRASRTSLILWFREASTPQILRQIAVAYLFSKTTSEDRKFQSEFIRKAMTATDIQDFKNHFYDVNSGDSPSLSEEMLNVLAESIQQIQATDNSDGNRESQDRRNRTTQLLEIFVPQAMDYPDILSRVVRSSNEFASSYIQRELRDRPASAEQQLPHFKSLSFKNPIGFFQKAIENIQFGIKAAIIARRNGVLNLNAAIDALKGQTIISERSDPQNFSSFQIQSYLLKKLLSVSDKGPEVQMMTFEKTIAEIEVFLSRPPVVKYARTSEDLQGIFESLESEYRHLDSEMTYGESLDQQNPIILKMPKELIPELDDFTQSFRDFDMYLDMGGAVQGFAMDLLSANTNGGRLAREMILGDQEMKQDIVLRSTGSLTQAFDQLKSRTKTSLESATDGINPLFAKVLIHFIENYFLDWSFSEAQDVLKRIIERPDQRSLGQILSLIVQYSDPNVIKFLQIVKGFPQLQEKEIQDILEPLLEDNVASAYEEVRPQFHPPLNYRFLQGGIQRYGKVGSIAEARFNYVVPSDLSVEEEREIVRQMNDQPEDVFEFFWGEVEPGVLPNIKNPDLKRIVSRTKRHGIEDKVATGKRRLLNAAKAIDEDPVLKEANFPKVYAVLENLILLTERETDFELTAEYLEKGKSYRKSVSLPVPEAFGDITINFSTPDALSSQEPKEAQNMEEVPGQSLDKFASSIGNRAMAQKIVEEVSLLWLEEVLIGSRFFHADLQPANIKVHKKNDLEYDVYFIDWGLSGELTVEQKDQLMPFGLSAFAGDLKKITEIIFELSVERPEGASIEHLRGALQESIANFHKQTKYAGPGVSPAIGPLEFIVMAYSAGYKIPLDFFAAGRGLGTIISNLSLVGSDLTPKQLFIKLFERNPMEGLRAAFSNPADVMRAARDVGPLALISRLAGGLFSSDSGADSTSSVPQIENPLSRSRGEQDQREIDQRQRDELIAEEESQGFISRVRNRWRRDSSRPLCEQAFSF